MMLLDNSMLPNSTFNNITSILIADAKDKNKDNIQSLSVPIQKIDALCSTLESATSVLTKYQNQSTSDDNIESAIQIIREKWDEHEKTVKELVSIVHRKKGGDRVPYAISLDSAVSALRDIKSDTTTPMLKISTDTLPPAMKPEMAKRIGTMINKRTGYKRMEYNDRHHNNYESRFNAKKHKFNHKGFSRIPANTGPKSKSRCVACGEMGHWKGDDECLDNESDDRRVRFDQNRHNSRDDDTRPRSYFQ